MKNPFRGSPDPTPKPGDAPASYDPLNPPLSADGWNPAEWRDTIFQALAGRVGAGTAKTLREDFENHLKEDPVNGVEAAYVCLCGKLVDTVDRFTTLLGGNSSGGASRASGGGTGDGPISPFTTFRKDG